MRLLDAAKFVYSNATDEALEEITDEGKIPPYAILSHTWGKDEITYKKLTALSREDLVLEAAFDKIIQCCLMALKWGLKWVWMDTCSINQSSSAELSEAINSMFHWYKQSVVCFAYLSDTEAIERDFSQYLGSNWTSAKRISSFHSARWFKRGWCLQELLAPRNMHFYNRNWEYIGSKNSLRTSISSITGIAEYGMFIPDLSVLSIAERMSWAAKRETTRPEDVAYCLLGIFNINMPLLYGEGQVKAFYRLQEEIVRRVEDHSIFAWSSEEIAGVDFGNDMVGLLAPHPVVFGKNKVDLGKLPQHVEPLSITGRGIRAQLPLIPLARLPLIPFAHSREGYAAIIGCCTHESSSRYYAVPISRIKEGSDVCRRISPELLQFEHHEVERANLETVFLLRQSNPTYLEDKDTMQVWFSLLEMKDCIYSIIDTYPTSHWNLGRLVFAFSPQDFLGRPDMAVIFATDNNQGFVLRIRLDMAREVAFCSLMGLDRDSVGRVRHFGMKWDFEDAPTSEDDSLVLEGHSISALARLNTIFGQDLYEVQVVIRA